MKTTVTLGEIMLRLRSPERYTLLQVPEFEATFGGGEANVAVSLSLLGAPSRFVSAVPANPIGDACVNELRRYGVDVAQISRKGERLGIYFLETGANQRPSKVIYDRAHSAISEARPDDFDWDAVFSGSSWLHVTGITPAISLSASDLATRAVYEAKRRGLTVSVDINYRAKLWKYGKKATEVMPDLVRRSDVLVANEEDCQKALGIPFDDSYERLTDRVLAEYPNLSAVAVTLRQSRSADDNDWSAILNARNGCLQSRTYAIRNIVDRVGGGDSFAAGLIYGMQSGWDSARSLEFAVAASCLKHSISGDFNLATKSDIDALLAGNESGRVQR